MHVVDLLVRQPPVVLQHVVVLRARGDGDLLEDTQDVDERVVGDVG